MTRHDNHPILSPRKETVERWEEANPRLFDLARHWRVGVVVAFLTSLLFICAYISRPAINVMNQWAGSRTQHPTNDALDGVKSVDELPDSLIAVKPVVVQPKLTPSEPTDNATGAEDRAEEPEATTQPADDGHEAAPGAGLDDASNEARNSKDQNESWPISVGTAH